MVNKNYSAIYTDDLGCETAKVYFIDKKLYLEVRGMSFYSEDYGVDLYTENVHEARKKFLLKDNELIGYILDIQLPILIEDNNFKKIKKVILRLEREKNYYNNSLLYEDSRKHNIKGYNLKDLFYNMKRELSKKCNLKLENSFQI